ncbi:MAG: carboxypeptidase-like regulatory domain-containing protein [Bacteroidetes bacterium]|nr:carboxypeptidase-like regulatory domain-containing protein [Bacteroidota bacterium]
MKLYLNANGCCRFLLLLVFFFIRKEVNAQNMLSGKIVDDENGNPVPGVVIQIEGTFFRMLSNEEGQFDFSDIHLKEADLSFTHISFEKNTIHVHIPDTAVSIRLRIKNYLSEEVTITSTRMDTRSGLAFSTTNKEELEKKSRTGPSLSAKHEPVACRNIGCRKQLDIPDYESGEVMPAE